MAKSFRELRIWQKGYDLLIKVYDITAKYPTEEKYALTSDTRRSANSVIANIAESHGRFYFQDKIRVLYIARGEVEETRSHLAVGAGRSYFPKEDYEYLEKEYEGLAVGINFYIADLDKQNQKT